MSAEGRKKLFARIEALRALAARAHAAKHVDRHLRNSWWPGARKRKVVDDAYLAFALAATPEAVTRLLEDVMLELDEFLEPQVGTPVEARGVPSWVVAFVAKEHKAAVVAWEPGSEAALAVERLLSSLYVAARERG